MTKYEKQIYEIVLVSRSHPTAEQVLEALRERYPAVSQASVYNNLRRLCEEGLIRRIPVPGGADRYDRTARHDHLVCAVCGALTDVSFDDLTAALTRQLGEEILGYDLRVRHVCPACRARGKA